MSKYCEETGEVTTKQACMDCGDESCEVYREFLAEQAAEDSKMNSELAQQMRKHFSSVLGVSDEKIDGLIENMLKQVFETARDTIHRGVQRIAQEKAGAYIEKLCEEYFSKEFEVALDSHLLSLERQSYGSPKYVEKTVRELVTAKAMEFFDKDINQRRESVSTSLDEAIGRRADRVVKTALEELKAECIEKFDKAMMKKMMIGMAKEIQSDQRLLAVLSG